MPRLKFSDLAETRAAVLAGVDTLPARNPWPFRERGTAGALLAVQAETERRIAIDEHLQFWLVVGDWQAHDDIDHFLLRARFWWGLWLVDSLVALPVYLRRGSLLNTHSALVVSWPEHGFRRWRAELDDRAYWYSLGMSDCGQSAIIC